ncbi:hypothetical protein E2C01_003128 [Portunus trituberculatus]|uniref:Uncharacterized protein n=1 Tax=Portunus trituberculatus TaxID=210409 RepID=A0A5B7CNW6_PORTR|nr:hypothetical protein [Portunus trituberculatus]
MSERLGLPRLSLAYGCDGVRDALAMKGWSRPRSTKRVNVKTVCRGNKWRAVYCAVTRCCGSAAPLHPGLTSDLTDSASR